MADKKGGKFTNARLHEPDAAMLAELAALRRVTVAELFRLAFAEQLRRDLISEQKRRTAELERAAEPKRK